MADIDDDDPKIAPLDPAGRATRRAFLAWQCRIRQMAVRRAGGRPSAGMRPGVSVPPHRMDLGPVIVLIRKKASQDTTAQFRHMVKRTRDPAERRESALRFLAAAYYQTPDSFSDEMTALFGPCSALLDRVLDAGRCVLDFEQFEQRYRLNCRVCELASSDPAFEFTFWHNSLFNPAIPADARVIAFKPDWSD